MISERVAPPDPVVAAQAAPGASPELQYAKTTTGVTRRQMNLLLLFIVIDTLLFAAFVCLPTASPYLKSMWADYQKQREEKRHAAVIQAKLNACLTRTAPADQPLYVEEPAPAERLLASNAAARQLNRELGTLRADGVYVDRMARLAAQVSGWQPPARAGAAPELINWRDALPTPRPQVGDSETTLVSHEMRTPAGQQRLAIVSFTAVQYIEDIEPQKAPHRHFEIQTQRTFTAHVINPNMPMPRTSLTRVTIDDPKPGRAQLLAVFANEQDPRPVVDYRPAQHWRIFPGQVDPADPTHLTIPYEIEGKPGIIDGRLNDGDRLMLTPRAGRLAAWTSGTEYTWDLMASASTTQTSGSQILKVK